MRTILHFCRYAVVILLSLQPTQGYQYFLEVNDEGGFVRITTNVKLPEKENTKLTQLSSPNKVLNDNVHYIFVPGRADHDGKLPKDQFSQRNVWCIDPYGQGGSSGGVRCESHDKSSEQPCCPRKGHASWDNYMQAYVKSIAAIHDCLRGKGSPQLVVIACSLSANVDMCARLHPEYSRYLDGRIHRMHYVAPMVSFPLFLKDTIGERGEDAVRYALWWVTSGLSYMGYGDRYFFLSKGPINPHTLTQDDVADKIAVDKRNAFIDACKQNVGFEIGSITNLWFSEASYACRRIGEIKPDHFGKTTVHVHVPGDDKVVYPHRVVNFFKIKGLPHKLHEYPNEPHNLFWGSDDGITLFIKNITTEG